MKFKNNSCTGIYRSYQGFELEIPGNSSVDIPIPDEHEGDVRAFLKQYHPVVEISAQVVISAPVTAQVEETGMFVHDFITLNGLKADAEEMPAAPALVAVPAAKPAKVKPAKAAKAPKAPKKTTGGKK